jgi:hypothetical protein
MLCIKRCNGSLCSLQRPLEKLSVEKEIGNFEAED